MRLVRATWFINNPFHFVNFYCHINNNDWDSQWLCLITYTKHHNKHKYILDIYGKSSSKTKREFHGVLSGIWFHLMCRDYTWESSLFHWAFLYLALHALCVKSLAKVFIQPMWRTLLSTFVMILSKLHWCVRIFSSVLSSWLD